MKPDNFKSIIYCSCLLVLLFGLSCKDDTETIEEPEELEIAEFTFIPENPSMKDEISMLFYGCSYFQTTSVVIADNKIDVRKHFNSRLKWPCILVNDTISIGKLKKGDYLVTLYIIDLNSLSADSVFHAQTKQLSVSNK